jgi:hypothetical protein
VREKDYLSREEGKGEEGASFVHDDDVWSKVSICQREVLNRRGLYLKFKAEFSKSRGEGVDGGCRWGGGQVVHVHANCCNKVCKVWKKNKNTVR